MHCVNSEKNLFWSFVSAVVLAAIAAPRTHAQPIDSPVVATQRPQGTAGADAAAPSTDPRLAASRPLEFYVSTDGSDANPGTLAQPFASLVGAQRAIRAINRPMAHDIIVYLRGGTYRITTPLTFGVEDSATNGFRIIYRALGGEVPVLDGGVIVTGWTPDHGGIYRAPLVRDEKLRSLFVNGARAEMAAAEFDGLGGWGEFSIRGNETWAETPEKTIDGVMFNAGGRAPFAHPDDLEIAQNETWNAVVVGVRDLAVEGNRMVAKLQQPYGAIAASLAWHCAFDPAKRFTLRNAYELLTRPGQFYFNRATHTLYYFPRPGENMTQAQVIAPLSEGLLRVTGDSTTHRVEGLTFAGITFTHDHWLLQPVGNSRGFAGVQSVALYTKFRADGNLHRDHYNLCDLPQATIELRNCRDIRFERNRFTHLSSGTGISLVNDAVDCSVVGNAFSDLLGNAINLGHPQHYEIGDGPLFPASVEGACGNDVVANNWIRQVSLDFHQEEAISGFFTQSARISHNDISGVPYGGIALGWWWGDSGIPPSKVPRDNAIVGNRVTATNQLLPKDGGPIYVLGEQPGGLIADNYVEGARRLMYADDGSADWTIRHNVFYVTPWTEPPATATAAAKPKYPDHTWLFLWTPRIHDLTIDSNFSNVPIAYNAATHTSVAHQTVAYPFPAQAQQIVDAAGLEPAYRDMAAADPATLPNPLLSAAGANVTHASEWRNQRRAEVLELFRTSVYGHAPGRPPGLMFRTVEEDKHAMSGRATRREVDISFPGPRGRFSFRLLLYVPNAAPRPVPVFLLLNNRGDVHDQVNRPFFPVDLILARGYAAAGISLGQISPDDGARYRDGVIGFIDGTKERAPDAWRTIAAWAWGGQRAMDYFETDPELDAQRVAVVGHSRGGKTALWCGAQDERFALTISNDSGAGGAALARGKTGERVADLVRKFPYWFAANYAHYAGAEDSLPVDQHELVALLAPRLAYVASAADDAWADPTHEFLSCVDATPVYHLFGMKGMESIEQPPLGQPIQDGRIGYHIRQGGHGLTELDWESFMDFADRHLKHEHE